MKKPTLLIIGHLRHGKDTCAEILKEHFEFNFNSSSQAASDIFIFDELKDKYGYKTPKECFDDRFNHRAEWFNMICDYNKDDKARLGKEIVRTTGNYVGMRSKDEINECLKQNIFDLVIWIDASKRLPLEDSSSFDIDISIADIIIDNNGTEEQFVNRVMRFGDLILKRRIPTIKSENNMSIIQILLENDIIVLNGDDPDDMDMEMYELPVVVTNWPEIKDEFGDLEGLDLENWAINSLTDTEMKFSCSGDWQNPLMFKLIPDGNKLKAIDITDGYYQKDLSRKEIFEICKKYLVESKS